MRREGTGPPHGAARMRSYLPLCGSVSVARTKRACQAEFICGVFDVEIKPTCDLSPTLSLTLSIKMRIEGGEMPLRFTRKVIADTYKHYRGKGLTWSSPFNVIH